MYVADDVADDGEGSLVLVMEATLGPYHRNAILFTKVVPYFSRAESWWVLGFSGFGSDSGSRVRVRVSVSVRG